MQRQPPWGGSVQPRSLFRLGKRRGRRFASKEPALNDKMAAIHWLLHRECPGRLVRHIPTRNFHNFRLEGTGPTHWLHLPRQLVAELDGGALERLLLDRDCIGRLNEAAEPIRLCLLRGGACEIGDGSLAYICECPAIGGRGAAGPRLTLVAQARPPQCSRRANAG